MISSELFLNTSYLGQLFKKEYGCNFTECVNKCRIYEACRLLLETNYRVYEVADMVGFPDNRYFVTIFKKYIGKTPSDFRENN